MRNEGGVENLKRKIKISFKLTVLLAMLLLCAGCMRLPATKTAPDSTFTIRFLDMGQADATLIECDGHYMLIDGGNKDDSSKMYAILENSNIDHLDLVVGTHADEDHIGGLAGALNYATADVSLCPTLTHDTESFENFAKYAEQNGGGIVVPEVGNTYQLGSSTITILGVNGGTELNNTSIILKIVYGDTSFLFTGDAEAEAEQAVMDSGADLSATVLKVGHHGSSDSTTEAFLEKVMPAYAVISVGAENTYLHPTDIALNKLENVNAEVFRTDLQGEITLTSDGKNISVATEKTASKEEIMVSGEEAAEKRNSLSDEDIGATRVTVPTGTEYILNRSTKKFHDPSCQSAKQMKAKNAVYFNGTRAEVIAMGYDPCGNCHP